MEAAFMEDLPSLGAAAQKATVDRFAWDKVFARQFDLYAKVVQERRTP
jgi:hypothetical protein